MSNRALERFARAMLLFLAITLALSAGFWLALSGRSDKRTPSRARLVLAPAAHSRLAPTAYSSWAWPK